MPLKSLTENKNELETKTEKDQITELNHSETQARRKRARIKAKKVYSAKA